MEAGEESLKIKRGDLEFETDKFVLKKGDKVTLKIELLPGKVQVVRDGKVIGTRDLPLPPKAVAPPITPGPASPDPVAAARVPMFNSKDLTGWEHADGKHGNWEVGGRRDHLHRSG